MKKIYKFTLASAGVLLAFALSVACHQSETASNSPARQIEITVSAAASLQDAFQEIGALYDKQTGIKINFNFASSGVLQKQIEQGAPVDVFASAGQTQMNALAEKNLIAMETQQDFARNKLVLISPSGAAQVPTLSFAQYLEKSGAKIAIGNPKTVPAGQYAEQTLMQLNVWEKLQPRLVLGENVRQVLDYVERGEVEFGIVYASDVTAAGEKASKIADAPADSHEPILYPIAVIQTSQNHAAAQKFVQFVLSSEGQQTLQKFGFEKIK